MMNRVIALLVLSIFLLASKIEAMSDTGVGLMYKLPVTQDVWLENSRNYNHYQFVIVGQHAGYPLKRSLLKFEDLPDSCRHIKWAKMYLYFAYSHKPSWMSVRQVPYISRPLQVHQVKKNWSEFEATKYLRFTNESWSQPWLALDGRDADPNGLLCEPVTICTYRPAGFVEFDITTAVRNWQYGDPNYGVLVLATNEDALGRDTRFYSKTNRDSTKHPFLNVLCDYNYDIVV